MRIFVVGPPGSGKNVIAQHLANHFDIKHLNYRKLVIDFCSKKTPLSKKLNILREKKLKFPEKDAFEVIRNIFQSKKMNNFVLDGYPKSAKEADYLVRYMKEVKSEPSFTFVLSITEKTSIKRLKRRLVCPQCSYLLHDANPDSILNFECLDCHVPLIKRQDDTDREIYLRLKRYRDEKGYIIDKMAEVSAVYKVDGSLSIAETINYIIDILEEKNNINQAEKGARLLIENLGLNLADPNYLDTPIRLVRALSNLTAGQHKDAERKIREHFQKVFPTRYKGMIIMEPIKSISLCAHHLLPINYDILFGYIPSDKSLGFSKIIKVINILSAKASTQEDFTQEVIDIFDDMLKPKGTMVVVRGRHSCMSLRGEKSDNTNVTSALRGVFKDEKRSRDEFLALARFNT